MATTAIPILPPRTITPPPLQRRTCPKCSGAVTRRTTRNLIFILAASRPSRPIPISLSPRQEKRRQKIHGAQNHSGLKLEIIITGVVEAVVEVADEAEAGAARATNHKS